jgi:sacsin
VGYITAEEGLLSTGEESMTLKCALEEAKAPVIYIPEVLRQKVKHLFKGRTLCARKLGSLLQSQSSLIRLWSFDTKQIILEYLLSDPGYLDYGTLELFPFEDHEYRSLIDHTAFIHRNDLEKALFSLEKSSNLDLSRVKIPARLLDERCEKLTVQPGICYRSAYYFSQYCLRTIFKDVQANKDTVSLDPEAATFVSRAWPWICERSIDIRDSHISGLWLIPLANGTYRKIKPCHSSSEIIFAPEGDMGDLLRNIYALSPKQFRPLLITGPMGLDSQPERLLANASRHDPTLLIKDGGNIVHFVQWLSGLSHVIKGVSERMKDQVTYHIATHLPIHLLPSDHDAMTTILRKLEIFKKISWKTDGSRMYVRYLGVSLLTFAKL